MNWRWTSVSHTQGPRLSIRHPQWTQAQPRQDIPILLFTLDQWNSLQKEEFSIGAAPMGPKELGRNSKYVFALPAATILLFQPALKRCKTSWPGTLCDRDSAGLSARPWRDSSLRSE